MRDRKPNNGEENADETQQIDISSSSEKSGLIECALLYKNSPTANSHQPQVNSVNSSFTRSPQGEPVNSSESDCHLAEESVHSECIVLSPTQHRYLLKEPNCLESRSTNVERISREGIHDGLNLCYVIDSPANLSVARDDNLRNDKISKEILKSQNGITATESDGESKQGNSIDKQASDDYLKNEKFSLFSEYNKDDVENRNYADTSIRVGLLTLRTHSLTSIFQIFDSLIAPEKDSLEEDSSSAFYDRPIGCLPLLKEALCHQKDNAVDITNSSSVERRPSEETVVIMAKPREVYTAVMDFTPMECDVGAIPMKYGQEVEIIDSSKPRKWLVKTRPMKGGESQEGWVPTCYLEKKTMSMTDLSARIDTRTDPKEREAAARREAIVKELVETEEDFARDMQYVVDNYYLEMDNPRMPKELRDQRDLLFTNFKPICEFHNNVLIKGVQYHAKEPALLGKTFLRLERDFDMHVNYCRDETHAQQLLSSGPLKSYFDEHSKRIGDDKILAEHLKLPIQRLNDYQLLLRELIKYTARLKEDTGDLQKALDFMECIPQRSADLKYLNAMEGYRGSIHKLGRLVKHGWLEVHEESKPKLERYVFLFKAHIFITEVIRVSSSRDTYLVKNIIKLQNVEVVEKLAEDDCAFRIQHKSKDQSGYPLLLRASNKQLKEAWIRELVNQSAAEDLGEDEPQVAPVTARKPAVEEPEAKKLKVEREVENTESDVRSVEMDDECTDAKIPSLTSDIKIELPEEEGTTNITESLRSESASSIEDIDANPKSNPSKPQFQKSLRGINCIQGEHVTFECVVSATPTPTVKWLKNNKPITKSQRIKIAAQGNKYTLTVKEALLDDTGLYTVMASNPGGIASCSATLNVNQGMLGVPKEDSRPTTPGGTILPHQPVFKVKLKDTELLEGTSVRFELVVRGHPQPKVTFYKDGQELKEDDHVRVSYESGEVFELIIDHVVAADAGRYSCVAVNSEGKDTTVGVISVTKHKILFKGLEEELERPPTPKPFKWFKDGQEFEASERFQVSFSEEEDTLALVFQRVTPNDAGLYTCVASTSSGNKISCSAELTVQGSINKLLRDPEAPVIKANLTDVEVSEGASAMLELKASGYPKPTVTWFKDGNEIKAGDRFRFLFEDEESFTLIIKNVRKSDGGKYKVAVKNDLGEATASCQLVVTCPPAFQKKLKDMAVMTNEPVRFEVEVEGKPTPEVKWYKDGQQLSENDRIKMLHDAEEIFAMVIEKVKPEDSGNYSCVLTNESGSQAGYSNLVVNAPPSFIKEMKNVECSEEETVSFTLKVSGSPKPSLKWMKDGKKLEADGKHIKVVEEEGNSYTLTICKVKKEDIGTYSCEISNSYGAATTSATLSTKGKPVFTKGLHDAEAKEGDANIEFTVVVEGSPKPTIKWSLNNIEITEEKHKISFNDQNKTYTLKIDKATSDMSGKYTCEAKNVHGCTSTSGILSVYKPPHFILPLTDTTGTEKENASLAVKYKGHPIPSVKWFKDGTEIKADGKHIKIKEENSESCILIVENLIKSDAGKYSCEISNKVGKETTTSTLCVNDAKPVTCKPGFTKKLKPVDLTIGQRGCLEAVVTGEPKPKITWLKNGEEITPDEHIIVKEEPSGKVSLIIDSVTPDDAGTFSVLAVNDSGDSMSTAQVNSKSPPGEKPSFISGLKPVQFPEGHAGRLEVKIAGEPMPSVKWLKDGKEISPSDHFTIMEEPDGTVNLLIDKISPDDAGSYAVLISNSHGEIRSEAPVTTISPVTGQKPEILAELKTANVVEGQPLKLEAKVSGEISCIKWLKNGEEVSPSDHIQTAVEQDGTLSLIIHKAVPGDAGKYSITVSNALGKAHTSSLVDVSALVKEKPSIAENLQPLVIKQGETGKLTAKVIGESPDIIWMKDGKEIASSDRFKMEKEPDGSVALLIENMVSEDAGKYSLVVANKHGENRSSAPISVTHPPCFIKTLKPLKVIEGYPVKFSIEVAGIPVPDIKWLKDGVEIHPDDDHITAASNGDGVANLLIKKCVLGDVGEYKCIASNSCGESSSTGTLAVKEKGTREGEDVLPMIISPLKSVTVKEGEPLILEAEVSGSPAPEVTWYLDGTPLQPTETILPMFDGNKVVLEIKKSAPELSGKFECRLTNPLGEASSTGNVNVLEKQAPRFTQRLFDTKLAANQPAKFCCRVKGDPTPEIKWCHNGALIESGVKYNISKDGENCILSILNPSIQDGGIYECRAKNSAGEDISSAQISFSDKVEKGEAPIFLKKIGDAEALEGMTVKFTACIAGVPQPEAKWFKDGQQLDSTAQCKIEQESTGILRLIIRHVDTSDFGEYRVNISNVHGSESCAAHLRPESFEPKIPLKPLGDQYIDFDKFRKSGAPVPLPNKPYIIRLAADWLTLGWKPSIPTSPRVPVTYQIEKCRHPEGEWQLYKSGIKDCICEVLGLEPFQDYRFRIRVENKYGISDPSPYVTTHHDKLMEPTSRRTFEPMDYEIDHYELEKHAEAPRFLRKEDDAMYGVLGQPVTIEFWVYGYPEPEITWYFEGNLIDRTKYDFLQDRNGKVAVFISAMSDDNVGTYVCHATNDLGDARQAIKLQIAEMPVFKQRLERTAIMTRRSGRLECRVTGLPYPKIKWYKDWFPIYDSNRFRILWEEPDKCILFLDGTISKDGGLYSCTATNLAGSVSTSAIVTIEESDLEYSFLTYSRPHPVKPRPKTFEDFYDIGDELGRGTEAIIHHAVKRTTGKSYAAKVMHGKGKARDFMNAEMDIMNHLCHPHLVRLWDAFESKNALTLITDICDGSELLDNILKKGKLKEREIALYVKQILEGIEHMHGKNIGHLGLTIGDILVSYINADAIKIGDFGVAAHLHPDKEYFLDYGHPEFVAPEIANKQAVSLLADMWSIGVITYLLLSGISPFLAENDKETLKKVQQGKINFFPDAFIGVSNDAKDFMSKLLVFDPSERMDVKTALNHRWITGEGIVEENTYLNNIDRLSDYHKKWKEWYSNASCKRFYRRRPLESCFTHPSRMIYPPGEEYTPPSSPEPELDRTHVKPAEFDDTYKQKINREALDFRSETNYQNGPDTYLLQLRDTDFPLRIREYLRVGASSSLSLANSLSDQHWGSSMVSVRERRRFVDIMDEEIGDEQEGRVTRTVPMRLHHELGTSGYAREQMEMLKKEVWKDKSIQRETEIGYAPYFREKLQDVVIQENQAAVFTCHIIGDPAPTYTWFRNDGIVLESSRIQVKQLKDGRCQLCIDPGRPYDVGVYKCVARNLHGEAVCRARLKLGTVPERPDAPEIDQYSDNAVYITWKAPRYTGNTTVLCYCVEYKKTGDPDWAKIASNISHEFYVIHNLTASTTYQFRISAKNKFGWSEPSLPTERVTTMAEGAPKIKITKARKYQQEMTEKSDEVFDETSDEDTSIDYSIEKNPVPLIEGMPSDLYNFIGEITRGKFSFIVKSWIKALNSTMVTKIIQGSDGQENAGKKEYEIHKSLCHKNILQLESASWHENVAILVMEKLPGMDVLTYLTSHTEYNEETVAKIIMQVLNALEYLHFRGICYIELQPDNVVMIDPKYSDIKLIDFGSAHFVPKAGGKVDVKGKLEYLAPEVITNEDIYTTTDVWAVGVLTYILLSGCSPFRGENDEITTNNITFARYLFDNLYKECTVESSRFLIQVFKKCPLKRPTVAECLENKWLIPSEFMLRKRENAIFLSHRLHEFSEEFHTEKQSSTIPELMEKFGSAFSRSVSLEVDAYEEI